MSIRFTSFKEYILYLYIHIAYADSHLHESERELIYERMKILFPGEDPAVRFTEMAEKYIAEKEQSMDIIKRAHEQFHNIQFYRKYKVFLDLYDIINADGVVHESEQEAMDKLKEIIGIETGHDS